MKRIKIFGASTLERYTNNILKQGFINNFYKIVNKNPDEIIFQIHGVPKAKKEDKEIIKQLENHFLQKDIKPITILLHRPDEIQDKLPELRRVLEKAQIKFGLVFFGNHHAKDKFYKIKSAIIKIIPHGFFDFKPYVQIDPIVIGTYTSWGEMRSVDHVLKLLDEVFNLKENENIVGYLGGKPKEELQLNKISKLTSNKLIDAKKFNSNTDFSKSNIIFIDSEDSQPKNLGITFNTQLYFYGNKIRTGESSGSAHMSASIPVVLEMNDADIIENLKVIKIPYKSIDNINSVDFRAGAKLIINLIRDKKYETYLKHNLKQSKKFNNSFIAKEYIDLFEKTKKINSSKKYF